MSFQIEFKVMSRTEFGESAVICGNLPSLGEWQPARAHRLATDEHSYPYWTSTTPLCVNPGTTLEFKLCLVDQAGTLIRWEAIEPNRIFSPRSSLLIEFQEAEGQIICQIRRVRIISDVELKMVNVRKGTEDVLDDLQSDSSSNRDMWKEHRFLYQNDACLLLNEFVFHLNKAISTQREQSLLQVQQPEMQLQKQIKLGHYSSHASKTHYVVVSSKLRHNYQRQELMQEQIVLLSLQELTGLALNRKNEVSIFHLVDSPEDSEDMLRKFSQWRQNYEIQASHKLKGLLVLYLDPRKPHRLPKQEVDIVVCPTIECLCNLVEQATVDSYSLVSCGKDEFDILEGHKLKTKIIGHSFDAATFTDRIHQHLERILPVVKGEFYFRYGHQHFRKQLRLILKGLRSLRCRCLIVFHVNKLEQLSMKTIGDLIQLSSLKHDVTVGILVHQKLASNVKERVPVTRNNLLIYFNGQEAYDIFKHIEISKLKFQENLRLIVDKLESQMIVKQEAALHKVVLNLPKGTLGKLAKDWAFRCVKDINRKSLAKISIYSKQARLQLIPFVLHQTFLLKTLLGTFAGKLNRHEKGMVISIETERINELKWLQPPEGAEVNLQFLRVCLTDEHKSNRNSYGSFAMSSDQLHQLLDHIAEESEMREKNTDNYDQE